MELKEIQTVKISGGGYLLNGAVSVPKADGNREYEIIKQWLAEGNTPEPEFTEEELSQMEAERLALEAKSVGDIYTLNNVDYQVPFMKDDADGLLQVKEAFNLGINETVIHFTNGTKMPITADEFMDFAVWFVEKRNSFFIGE